MQGSKSASEREEAQLRALGRAMADPLRSKLLIAIADKEAAGVTIGDLAKKVREPNRRVRYHLDALVGEGLVAVAGNRKRRGVLERFYRSAQAPMMSTEQLETFNTDEVRKMNANVLKAVIADISEAAAAGTLGARSAWVTVRMPADVDSQGWKELEAIQVQAIDKAQTVLARAQERLAANLGEEPIHAVLALIQLEAPPWPS
jgi:DNA-binding transcriptional ArsR family regulator